MIGTSLIITGIKFNLFLPEASQATDLISRAETNLLGAQFFHLHFISGVTHMETNVLFCSKLMFTIEKL
jgi:hypothetical protein